MVVAWTFFRWAATQLPPHIHLLQFSSTDFLRGRLDSADWTSPDRPDQVLVKELLTHYTSFDRFNAVFSGRNTSNAATVIPASLLIVGVVRGDAYARNTALLAGEAVVDAEMVTSVMKNISHRLRPAAVPTNQLGTSTWFRDKGVTLGGAGSFPSGHTIAAFSVATVFSHRYRHHRWVPYVSYGLAGLVGFSRISLLSHFSSDVLMGAALGYSISRFVVLRTRPA